MELRRTWTQQGSPRWYPHRVDYTWVWQPMGGGYCYGPRNGVRGLIAARHLHEAVDTGAVNAFFIQLAFFLAYCVIAVLVAAAAGVRLMLSLHAF